MAKHRPRHYCRLAHDGSRHTGTTAIPRGADAATIVADGSLAYLAHVQVRDGDTPEESRSEFVAHAFGPAGPALAQRLASCVKDWDRHVRSVGYPSMTIHPAGTPDHELPAGDVLDTAASRLVFQWPGRPAGNRSEALTTTSSNRWLGILATLRQRSRPRTQVARQPPRLSKMRVSGSVPP